MKFDYGELGYERKSILAARKRIESFLSDKGISLNLDTPEFHTDAVTLKELKIAAIMDEFTFFCYQPEYAFCRIRMERKPRTMERQNRPWQQRIFCAGKLLP